MRVEKGSNGYGTLPFATGALTVVEVQVFGDIFSDITRIPTHCSARIAFHNIIPQINLCPPLALIPVVTDGFGR